MSLVAEIKSGFKIDLLSTIIDNLSRGLLVIVLARLLQPEEYGLLYLSISLFAVATLIGKLGLGKSAARYITEYEEHDAGQIPHIVETAAGIFAVTMGLVVLGLVLFHAQLAAIFGDGDLEILLLIGAVYVVTSGVVNSGRRLCQGFKRIEWAAWVKLADAIVRPIAAIGLVLAGLGVVGALAGYIISSVIAALLVTALVYRLYSSIERTDLEAGLRRRIAEYSLPIALTQNSSTVIKRVDVLLIGAFLTPLAVSYYVVSKQIISFIRSPANSLGFAIAPRYSEQIHRGNLDTASRLYGEALTSILLLYVPAAVGLVLVAEPTLTLVFGPEYSGGVIVLQILTVYLIAQTVSYITSSGLDYLGRAKYRAYAKGATAIGNLVLNVLLIPTIGIAGAAISTAATYAVYVVLNVYLMHRELNLDWRSIGRRCAKIGLVTAVMALVVFTLVSEISGFISLVAVVGLGVAVWFVGSLSVGLVERQQLRAAIPF
jgi:O-antigen/teichoic acid export membrane protein